MSLAKSQAATIRELKHRVLTCLNKLSDRDTYSAAASELEVIAKNLRHDSIPLFLSSISATDSTDKSPVRKQCLRLISLVSESHGDALSPYLSKLVTAVVRRLRDTDSAVRSSCVIAIASISSHITKPPFTSVVKPLVDALVTEQDINSQIGAALCLAAAIDGSPNPDILYLKKLLLRLERLLKCDIFRAKSALLTLFGSVIGAGAAPTVQTLRNLVPLLVEFIRCDDWAARKAAAETLMKLAVVERDVLPEFKAACLKTFEAKKFDKVKSVRETMNRLVETWKEIPDVSDERPLPEPRSSTKEDASDDGQYPPGSKISCIITSGAPQMRKKSILGNRSALPDGSVATTARKTSSPDSTDKRPGPAMFRKLDRKKSLNWKIEIASPHDPSTMLVYDDEHKGKDESLEKGEKLRSRFIKPETRRALFNKNAGDKMPKLDAAKSGSRVVPCHDADLEPTGVFSNTKEDVHLNQKEYEDISLIRKQLVHIENQQSNLLDLLQKFMGSSQDGMRSLETRVCGLELALDEISYDLAVTTGRMSKIGYEGTTCCKLPGADFFSPKFWKKNEPRHSTPGDTPPPTANRNMANGYSSGERFKLENRRFQHRGGGGFIMNPLAEVRSLSHGMPEGSSNRVSNNVEDAA
ncbi:TORTIFOLIA1-like protein 3 isoform X2 [Diospyros lotus]|uniref:TORTIFOLIA1-like protein 3 isoform X2 n=1 Tax=Diospyros lotus TaxID=55363 RepID=UPI0022543574|nr:TORTIFOLIA1-like protein 3 isoform X2 [Diospyros lotus]